MTTPLETTFINIFESAFVPSKPIEEVVACLFAKIAYNFGSMPYYSHKINAVICKYIKANYSKEKYFDASTAFINAEYINR